MVSKKLNYDEVINLIDTNIDGDKFTKFPDIYKFIRDEDKSKILSMLLYSILEMIDAQKTISASTYKMVFYIQKLARKLITWEYRRTKLAQKRRNLKTKPKEYVRAKKVLGELKDLAKQITKEESDSRRRVNKQSKLKKVI
ncbi:MAG: hypothetical protein ACYC49_09345 [Ignavibacteriaceae bacterium]